MHPSDEVNIEDWQSQLVSNSFDMYCSRNLVKIHILFCRYLGSLVHFCFSMYILHVSTFKFQHVFSLGANTWSFWAEFPYFVCNERSRANVIRRFVKHSSSNRPSPKLRSSLLLLSREGMYPECSRWQY